jgi:hypothetical protein
MPSDAARRMVAASAWCRDLASTIGTSAEQFGDRVLASLARTTEVVDGQLRTKAPHRPSRTPIPWNLTDAARWPRPGAERAPAF